MFLGRFGGVLIDYCWLFIVYLLIRLWRGILICGFARIKTTKKIITAENSAAVAFSFGEPGRLRSFCYLSKIFIIPFDFCQTWCILYMWDFGFAFGEAVI